MNPSIYDVPLDLCKIPSLYDWSLGSMNDSFFVWMISWIFVWSPLCMSDPLDINNPLFVWSLESIYDPSLYEWSLGSLYDPYFVWGILWILWMNPYMYEWSLGSLYDHLIWVIPCVLEWSTLCIWTLPSYTAYMIPFLSQPLDLVMIQLWDPNLIPLCMSDVLDPCMISFLLNIFSLNL